MSEGAAEGHGGIASFSEAEGLNTAGTPLPSSTSEKVDRDSGFLEPSGEAFGSSSSSDVNASGAASRLGDGGDAKDAVHQAGYGESDSHPRPSGWEEPTGPSPAGANATRSPETVIEPISDYQSDSLTGSYSPVSSEVQKSVSASTEICS